LFIYDKDGNAFRVDHLRKLYVDTDGVGGYLVKAEVDQDSTAASFNNGASMTQVQAQALLVQIVNEYGGFDPRA